MNLYTTKDLIKNTIFNYTEIRSLKRNNFFTNMKLINKKAYFSQSDLDKLIATSKFCECSYITEEAIKLLNHKGSDAYYLIKKYNFQINSDYILFNRRYYFNKKTIQNLVQNQCNIDPSYISIADCNKVASKKTYIYDGIRCGYLKEYTFENSNEKFITQNDFKTVLKELDIINSSYTSTDIVNYLGVTYFDLSQDSLKTLNPVNIRQRLYFNKNEIDKLFQKFKTPDDAYHNFFAKPSISKVYTLPNKKVAPPNYITVTMMCEKFNVTRDIILLCIKKKQFKNTIIVNNIYYVDPNEYILLTEEMKQSIHAREFQKQVLLETGIKLPLHNSVPLKKLFPTAFKWDKLGQVHYRLPLKDVEYFMKNDFETFKIKYLVEHEKNHHKVLQMLISSLNIKYLQKTINEFNIFATHVFNKSRSLKKKHLAYDLYATLKEITDRLNKDFNLLTDTEIQNLILTIPTRCKLHFSNFLNRYKALNPSDCNYSSTYNNYSPVAPNDKDDNYYTEEEWFKYLNYLCDIDTHIIKAFKRRSYSRRWLYLLLHFCTTLRKSTYSNLPNILNIDINHYDLEWFKYNEFTISNAQYIVNNAKLFFDNELANKNNLTNRFIVFPCMLIPVAIALIVAEQHSRKNNTPLIGTITSSQSDLATYFGSNMAGFTSLKSNRTLLTYSYAESASKEGYTSISYVLASTQRSHTINEMGIAAVTHQYLYSTNKDGDAANIAYHLHKRGIFGWLFKSLLSIIYPKLNLSISQTSDEIRELQSILSVKNIEGISKFLENENFMSQKIISELLSMNTYELEELLKKLKNFELPSKIDYTQCIKINNCPYPTNTMCYICVYSIPTNYTLLTINNKLIELLDKLDACSIDNTGELRYYSYIILKLLRVLTQAKKDFKTYSINGENYIDSFLDIDLIKEKYNKIQSSKLFFE